MKQHNEFLLMNRGFHDLNPLSAGWEKCVPGHSYGPHTREYYLMHYVVSGKGMFHTETGSFPVKQKEIFLIKPHEVTTYTADSREPWYYIWLGFDGALTSALDAMPPVLSYTENTFLELLQCEHYSEQKELFAASKIFEIFSEILDKTPKTPNYEKLVADYICANYMRPVKIEEIALQLGINRQYLSRRFKSAYGITMQQFLVRTRLSHAAHFLQDGSAVSQAAYLCGYEDVFNFSKMFKKEYGISPKEFKQSCLTAFDGKNVQ